MCGYSKPIIVAALERLELADDEPAMLGGLVTTVTRELDQTVADLLSPFARTDKGNGVNIGGERGQNCEPNFEPKNCKLFLINIFITILQFGHSDGGYAIGRAGKHGWRYGAGTSAGHGCPAWRPPFGSNRHAEADELHFELPLWA